MRCELLRVEQTDFLLIKQLADAFQFEILLEIGRDLFDYVENQQRQRILDEYGDLKSKTLVEADVYVST